MIIIQNYAGKKQKSYKIHDNENYRIIGQGEVHHRMYKRLKLGGGQAYDHSSDQTTVVAKATRNKA
jgi:hypothetical protein